MSLDRRAKDGTTASCGGKAASSQFASIQERRFMKKVAQPEHAYTGCVPYTPSDDDLETLPRKKNSPILGYKGHRRHDEDCIGTTFTQGLAVASRGAEPAWTAKIRPLNKGSHQVEFANSWPRASDAEISSRSGPIDKTKRSSALLNATPPAHGHASPRPDYDNADEYGSFTALSGSMWPQPDREECENDVVGANEAQTPSRQVINARYRQAIDRVGGEQAAAQLWTTAAHTVWQRHIMRTELLQAIRRSFEKHERINHGFLTKAQLKEALRDLGCVFTDDQITALFGIHDKRNTGTVPMSELFLALTDQL